MGQIAIKQITNANVYMDGASFLGKVEEAKLPDVVATLAEHKALGMIGKVELPNGIDKMEMTMKWNSLYGDVLKKAANPFTAVQLQCRCSQETYTGQGRTEEVPVTVFLTGTFKKFPLGGFKQHENVEAETTLAITYFRLVVNGEDIVEVDVLANIYKVGGVDLLAQFRSNIGG
ncbi:phage major tail tube protein [Geotalea uraniireducens]|uniref:Phage major tail tube protein n=1 Tax=Geotalea uraniireducens TaxID=351604 RepID=A0ABM8EJ19_9BACT|nr:phage major tail tube protein [Geotalea uraniireducens]BDV42440.1 phage major tail tube protein [Geotalea uraniireducens]